MVCSHVVSEILLGDAFFSAQMAPARQTCFFRFDCMEAFKTLDVHNRLWSVVGHFSQVQALTTGIIGVLKLIQGGQLTTRLVVFLKLGYRKDVKN